jgi:hypothetical protein
VTYRQFRTGLDFATVRAMLWVASDDRSTWKHKSRGVVLWHWRQLKQAMWAEYLARNPEQLESSNDNAAEHAPALRAVPALSPRAASPTDTGGAPAAKVPVRKEILHRAASPSPTG